MTTMTAAPADVLADIRERLRRGQTADQLIRVGERTGWWTADDVDWVVDGNTGPRLDVGEPADTEPAEAPWSQDEELTEVQEDLPAAGVVQPDASPAADPNDQDLPVVGSAYIAVLQARDLGVDHSYQRPLDEGRVERMAAAWEPRMLGTIDVSDRGPGSTPYRYAVINGQHRAVAAARVSPAGADVWLPCTVHEGLDVAAEARLMHELDKSTKKLSGFDQWRARRAAGDPAVVEVEAVCRIHGLRVDPNPTDGSMRAYGSAEKLLKLGGRNLLDNTLAVLRSAYGTTFSAFQAPLLMGVGQLLHREPTIDAGRLRNALANTRPEALRATASALRDIDGGPLHELMTRAIVGQYNRTAGPGPRLAAGRA